MIAKPYSLGCKKDPKDLRDIPMGLVLPAIPVPKSLDYGPAMKVFLNYGALPYDYMKKYCSDAWSGTDLIENPKALVKKKEELLNKFA